MTHHPISHSDTAIRIPLQFSLHNVQTGGKTLQRQLRVHHSDAQSAHHHVRQADGHLLLDAVGHLALEIGKPLVQPLQLLVQRHLRNLEGAVAVEMAEVLCNVAGQSVGLLQVVLHLHLLLHVPSDGRRRAFLLHTLVCAEVGVFLRAARHYLRLIAPPESHAQVRRAPDDVAQVLSHVAHGGPLAAGDGDEAVAVGPDLVGARDGCGVRRVLSVRKKVQCNGSTNEGANAAPHGEDIGRVERCGEEPRHLAKDFVHIGLLGLGVFFDGAGRVSGSQESAWGEGGS